MPKPTRVVEVPRDEFCYKHEDYPLKPTFFTSKRLIIDLAFSKNGVRKTITRYIGYQGFCKLCNRYYAPIGIRQFIKHQLSGIIIKHSLYIKE